MASDKILRVCLSKELPDPTDMDSSIIYFLYDTLEVYLGPSKYYDPFIITEAVPEKPIYGILYFTLDGFVKSYNNNKVNIIGTIENSNQLELLKQSGTLFFTNSQRRYLDLQTRVITLPFNNGIYELSISLGENLKIDNDTIIKFNPETNMFEVYGNELNDDKLFHDYIGKDSSSSTVTVSQDKRIDMNVKISSLYGNILQMSDDGLYASVGNNITKEQFNDWSAEFNSYKEQLEFYMNGLAEKIQHAEDITSEDSVNKRISDALEKVYPEIDEALANFTSYANRFDTSEETIKKYTDDKFTKAEEYITDYIDDQYSDPWGYF